MTVYIRTCTHTHTHTRPGKCARACAGGFFKQMQKLQTICHLNPQKCLYIYIYIYILHANAYKDHTYTKHLITCMHVALGPSPRLKRVRFQVLVTSVLQSRLVIATRQGLASHWCKPRPSGDPLRVYSCSLMSLMSSLHASSK
jgi:hypothetical protein